MTEDVYEFRMTAYYSFEFGGKPARHVIPGLAEYLAYAVLGDCELEYDQEDRANAEWQS